jgi:hypothetical protein
MVADRLTGVRALGIEAQAESFALARENVGRSWVAERVMVRHGDLRDWGLCERAREEFVERMRGADARPAGTWRGFDLITGTPPYKKPGTATPSPDPQRAHARIELRGGVEEYLATAARMLAPSGTVVVCMETGASARVEDGARAARLSIVERLDVVPIASGKGRLFSVFTLERDPQRMEKSEGSHGLTRGVGSQARATALQPSVADPEASRALAGSVDLHEREVPGRQSTAAVSTLLLRDALGARTPAALELRRFFGLGDPVDEAPSPPRVVVASGSTA